MEQEETLRETRAMLEASRRRESAAVAELARRNAEEARRVEQVRALLAASSSASAPDPCGDDGGDFNGAERSPTAVGESSGGDSGGGGGGRGGSNRVHRLVFREAGGQVFQGGAVDGRAGAEMEVGAAGSSVAATALSELAALEEAIAERAREVASLKVIHAQAPL